MRGRYDLPTGELLPVVNATFVAALAVR